jgi:hypothetical protein
VPLVDGGLLVVGRRAGTEFGFGYDFGFIVRLDASGNVTWQRDYGDLPTIGAFAFFSAVETATGVHALGQDMVVADLGADGSIAALRKYQPSAGTFVPTEIAKATDGGLLLTGFDGLQRKFLVLATAPDLGVTCNDAAIGASVDPKNVPSTPGVLAVLSNADLHFTITSAVATTPPLTLTPTPRTPTLGNVCGQ